MEIEWTSLDAVYDPYDKLHFCNLEHQRLYENDNRVKNRTPPKNVKAYFF